jgi:hypothetical protein
LVDAEVFVLRSRMYRGGKAGRTDVAASEDILKIVLTNPNPPDGFQDLLPQEIAYGGKKDPTFLVGGPFPSLDAQQEWKQVEDPAEDYEVDLIGASGWILQKEDSGADVPFTHPFGARLGVHGRGRPGL